MAYTEKYVSVAGGGAHDGTAGNEWTLAEAVANATAGNRVNIISGTYTLGASVTFPNGATENPIQWRGYNSTIGDLESVGRDSASGELNDTNYPVIDGGASYVATMGTYSEMRTLTITSAVNGITLTGSAVPLVYRCKLVNTHATGGAVRAFSTAANYGSVTDCDLIIGSNNSAAACIDAGRCNVVGNRTWNTTATPNASQVGILVSSLSAGCVGNVIFHCGTAIRTGGFGGCVVGNSWYDVTTGVNLSGDSAILIAENVGWLHAGYAITGTTSSGNILLLNNALGSYTSGRLDTGSLGTTIEETNPVTLTGNPFTSTTDFTLNNTASAGALCRAASRFWGGYRDLGALQTEPPAGGGGSALHLGGLGQTGIGVF